MRSISLLGSAMKKRGFTLIELMVVIVIMGILSSVAVPKLFGIIAKSKASELGLAAKTYIKLQDSYVSEHHQIGSWSLIGYVAPGSYVSVDSSKTNNFGYGGGALKGNGDGSRVAINENSIVGWIATSLVALNDVPINSSWTVSISSDGQGFIQYTASIPPNAGALTPSFTRLGN